MHICKSTARVPSFPDAKAEAARERGAPALWCTSQKNTKKTHLKTTKKSIKILKIPRFLCSIMDISAGRLTPLWFFSVELFFGCGIIHLQNYSDICGGSFARGPEHHQKTIIFDEFCFVYSRKIELCTKQPIDYKEKCGFDAFWGAFKSPRPLCMPRQPKGCNINNNQ